MADPDRHLTRPERCTVPERRQLLEWNRTEAGYPRDCCVHQLFQAQVDQTPEAMAITLGERRLTYRELDRRANRLAHRLRQLGVGRQTLVGVCLERSPEAVVGLLAIIKAGGAYVPLDPAYPAARLRFMFEDAQVAVLLTQQLLGDQFADPRTPIIRLDVEREAIARQSPERLESEVTPDDPLYVIYTSGSTGQPKGVVGLHRGAVNRFHWMWRTFPFAPGEICCQKTALSFVDSVWEIFGPLLQGVETVVIPEQVVQDPQAFVRMLAAAGVSRLVLVPSLLRVLLESYADLGRLLPALRFWVSSGESLPPELCRLFRERVPQGRLINLYGSSEVSADVTWYDASAGDLPDNSVPIGRPIANTQIYILDERMQPVPVGEAGEIYAGGAGLARGYLHRPDLTAGSFIADPFSGEKGARLYRTGDLGRYRQDGLIEYLGRRDQQVKLRGVRLEVGEIEAALARHPAVRESVVTLREDTPGDPRLVAYVVQDEAPGVGPGALRAYLQERLPAPMIPAAFVPLKALPLTPNGKLDRRALPRPDPARSATGTAYLPPETPLQRQLTAIWEEVLAARPIGIRDDFFELGGHSLLAVRLLSTVERVCGKRIPLTALFSEPTVEHMAAALVEEERAARYSALTPLQPGTACTPLFFVHGDQLHNGMYCVRLARLLGPDQPFYVLHNGPQVPHTIQAMAAEHIATMRAIQPDAPYRVGGYCAGGVVAFEMASQLQQAGLAVDLVALVEAERHDLRYAGLHRLISGAGALLGVDAALRLDLSVRLRFYAGRWHYYVEKLRHMSGRSANEQFNWLLRQARRSLRRRTNPRLRGSAQGQGGEGLDAGEERRAEQSLMRYNPRRFPGRVDLFWGGGYHRTHIDDGITDWRLATEQWRAVAGEVRVHVIPGTHGSLLTTHLSDLADRLQATLRATDTP